MNADAVLAALRGAPLRDLDEVLDWAALVIAPHPDDESLAFGGLIAEACARGRDIHVLVLTDGVGSHPGSTTYPPARLKALRESEARDAVAILGLPRARIGFLDQPDTRAPHDGADFTALADRVENFCRLRGIRSVLTCWRHDPHCDHEAASLLAAAVSRRIGARCFEAPVWGWTLKPKQDLETSAPRAVRIDVENHRPRKRRAVAAHRSQTTRMIGDSPNGFLLDADMVALLDQPTEVLIEA